MAVKIRLQRKGRKKAPIYHIVVADARAPRDGRYIARLGTYNPLTIPATIDIDSNEAFKWLMNGAQPTDTVRAILKYKGVYYKKHLQRGVSKGSLTQEKADELHTVWVESKNKKVEARKEQTRQTAEDRRARIFGTPKDRTKKVETVEEAEESEENNSENAE
jgi:small subunit ribosomal protein S16